MSGMPLGETLRHREIDFFVNIDEHAEINAISWEATIQKHIEEELYDPTLEVCMIFFTSLVLVKEKFAFVDI